MKPIWMAVFGLLVAAPAVAQPYFDDCPARTGANAHVVFPAAAYPFAPGDEVAVRTEAGRCAGRLTWSEGVQSFVLWQDDSGTDAVDGLRPGEALTFAAYDGDRERPLVVRYDTEGALRRADTFSAGALYVVDDAVLSSGRLGFGTSDVQLADAAQVPLRLDAAGAVDAIGGVRWSLRLADDDVIRLGTLTLSAAALDAGGRLEVAPVDGGLDVTLTFDAGLGAGTYDALVTVGLDALSGAAGRTTDLTLGDVAGTLADGADAGLLTAAATVAVSVDAPTPDPRLEVDALDLGQAVVGASATATAVVTNPDDGRTATFSAAWTDGALYTVEPAEATLAPGARLELTVTFRPTAERFSSQQDTLALVFAQSTARLAVTGFGVGGRGDANQDGYVSIDDAMLGVDYVKGRTRLSDDQVAALDVAPVGSGDGRLNRNDKNAFTTVLATGVWSDGVPAPLLGETAVQDEAGSQRTALRAAKAASASAPATLVLTPTSDGVRLGLAGPTPVQGLELTLTTPYAFRPSVDDDLAASTGRSADTLRVVVLHDDARALTADGAVVGLLDGTDLPAVQRAEGVTPDGERVPLRVTVGRAETATLPTVASLDAAYPNPFAQTSRFVLRLERAQDVVIEVFDVQGRRIERIQDGPLAAGTHTFSLDAQTWPSGLYFYRVVGETIRETREVTVVR